MIFQSLPIRPKYVNIAKNRMSMLNLEEHLGISIKSV
jgi:hypothetical protein